MLVRMCHREIGECLCKVALLCCAMLLPAAQSRCYWSSAAPDVSLLLLLVLLLVQDVCMVVEWARVEGGSDVKHQQSS